MKKFTRVKEMHTPDDYQEPPKVRTDEELINAPQQFALFNFSLTELRKRDCLIAQSGIHLNSRE